MRARTRRQLWRWAWVTAVVIALATPWHYRNDVHPANESARIYAAMAIVDHGTVHLDPVFAQYFPGWKPGDRPPNLDVANFEGRYVLDKAPGVTLLTLPILAVIRAWGGDPSFAALTWLLVFVLCAWPTALFARLLARRLMRILDGSGPWMLAGACVVSTHWLAYGGLLFGHALAASLAGAGMLLALGPLGEQDKVSRREAVLGGLLLGGAVLTEYPAALFPIICGVALLLDRQRRWRLPMVVLGGLGPLVVLLVWNGLLFGGPLEMSYHHKTDPGQIAIHAEGAFGMTWPSLSRLDEILLGAHRGLLFLAPWLALGFAGAAMSWFDPRAPKAWRIALSATAIVVPLVISGFVDWQAGLAIGPRHLLACVPVLAVGAAFALRAPARAAGAVQGSALGLMVSSAALGVVGAYVFPYFTTEVRNPLFEVSVPVLLDGGFGPTVWSHAADLWWGAWFGGALALAVVVIPGWHWLGRIVRRQPRATRVAPWLAACISVVAHVGLAAGPVTEKADATRRVLRERAVAHEMIGQNEHAQRIRHALRRLR